MDDRLKVHISASFGSLKHKTSVIPSPVEINRISAEGWAEKGLSPHSSGSGTGTSKAFKVTDTMQ